MPAEIAFATDAAYKDEAREQWDADPCGSHYVTEAPPDTLAWFLEAERYRYGTYAPWMRRVMEFDRHRGKTILEIGAGMGTDLAQFAQAGAIVHDFDLAPGHVSLAERNFALRGLSGSFHLGDAENMPFEDGIFDLVYANGVIHHTPNTQAVIDEIHRVLKPGGRCIVMVYAEYSLHYWRNLFRDIGLRQGMLEQHSMAEIMSASVEISEHGQRPLVKVYTARRLRRMFAQFDRVRIGKRQMIREELPRGFGWFPLGLAGRLAGWNLIVKAQKPAARGRIPVTGFDRARGKAGLSYGDWLAARRQGARQYTEDALPVIGALAARFPRQVKETIAAAEAFLAHRFALLGSGEFTPHDPDRPEHDGYHPIDWVLDPVRGLRFPRGVPYKEWNLYAMRPGNADIKYPWELARCQHWMTLAQAWRLSADKRFAVEIARQLDDFMTANPVGFGINWTCTMDVAIRAANWCLALALLHDCAALDARFWRRAHTVLFAHGDFIFANLENTYEVTSNHYLSNLVGLYVVAAEFGDLAAGAEWGRWCRAALETEIGVQVHEEGSDFESSVPYHRLVTELFLAGLRVARSQDAGLSEAYEAKLARMVEFGLALTRPDGRMPMIGDADDGRFHVFSQFGFSQFGFSQFGFSQFGFSQFGRWDPQDARHLLAPAACLLGRPEWLACAGEAGAWEAAWWGFDPASIDHRALPPVARLFPEFGVAVARQGGNYLAITNGKVGTGGFGNHKHNELLSFEYHCGGAPVIVDPGSFAYTADFAERNRFRGTACHNTLMIDGAEQNEINPEWIFRLFEKSDPEHLFFGENGDWIEYRGRHHGYRRLGEPVTHQRHFRFDRAAGRLLIEDHLSGAGAHDLAWHFHLAPDVAIEREKPGLLTLSTGAGPIGIAYDPGLAATVEAAWYSPSYGVKIPTHALALTLRAEIGDATMWRFALGPAAERSR